eukprot:gene15283-20587_t
MSALVELSTGSNNHLSNLCDITLQACDTIAPLVVAFYSALNSSDTTKLKADASVFTIADGLVQHLLMQHLFVNKFAAIVGEEDGSVINIITAPYKVEDLTIPNEFISLVDSVKAEIVNLSTQIDENLYKEITVFIDPIDGTREFSTALGEQCSICIGFADANGLPIAGVVYRPITQPPTFAAGAKSENYYRERLNNASEMKMNGFLTSNGGISPFIEQLIKELNFVRVPSGGAGNKMLMLLEGKGSAYIQDRGVSRWDTCGAQAVIESRGGILTKMHPFMSENKSLKSYTYLQSLTNLDFIPGLASLTPYNAAPATKKLIKKGDPPRTVDDVNEVAPYSNLCGLLALVPLDNNMETFHNTMDNIYEKMNEIQTKSNVSPSYD